MTRENKVTLIHRPILVLWDETDKNPHRTGLQDCDGRNRQKENRKVSGRSRSEE